MDDLLKKPPFFIVGAGRSGTTLVRAKLTAHSQLAVPPETHYMKRADQAGARNAAAPEDFEMFWSRLIAWQRFLDLEVEPSRVLELTDATGKRDFRSIFAAMLRAYSEAAGKPRAGEKTPGHYRYLDRIFAWFPEARIIAVRRDPRAVVASHLRSPWVTEQLQPDRRSASFVRRLRLFHVAERAKLWTEAYEHFLAGADADPRMHMVAYEDLVTRPEAELRRICAFLEETFEPGMLHETGDRHGTTSARASESWRTWIDEHESRAAAKVSTEGLEKWHRQLSALEVALIEQTCANGMARFGYRPDRPSVRRIRPLGRGLLRIEGLENRLRRRARRLRTRP